MFKINVGKRRDKAPESMIIPFLEHITKIQNLRAKVKCLVIYFYGKAIIY